VPFLINVTASIFVSIFQVNLGEPVLLGFLPPLVPEKDRRRSAEEVFNRPVALPVTQPTEGNSKHTVTTFMEFLETWKCQ